MIAAVHDGAEAGAAHTPTISLSVEYFAPVPEGALVEAEVDLVRKTASMFFVQSLMSDGERRIGRASAIYRNQSHTEEARLLTLPPCKNICRASFKERVCN